MKRDVPLGADRCERQVQTFDKVQNRDDLRDISRISILKDQEGGQLSSGTCEKSEMLSKVKAQPSRSELSYRIFRVDGCSEPVRPICSH